MNSDKKMALLRSLRYWFASFAVVAGFLYYKSNASLGSIAVAGVLTFVITVGRAWMRQGESGSN